MSEKTLKIAVRVCTGVCLLLFFLFAWVINPHINADPFSNETLWEAVHPYHWLKDSIGMLGFTSFSLYVGGFLGKAVYAFTEPKAENSSGLVHFIAIVSILAVVLLFV